MKIGVCGCAGRMGRMLMEAVLDTEGCELSGGSEHPASPALGQDPGLLIGRAALGCAITADIEALADGADALIDFTTPAATVAHAALAARRGLVLVIGTTGLSAEDEAAIRVAAAACPVVHAPNYSIGVTLLSALTERVAGILGEDDYDIEIVEMHHRHKVDAPSGTALGLGRAAAAGRGVALDQVWRKTRDGHTGARPKGEIGFSTLRGGDVVGDHSVIFAAEGERVELTHKASSRSVFARGAVRAALWARGRPAGLYTMRDVLGL